MKATPEDVQRAASGYVFRELGDRLYVDDPVFDEQRQQWTVPIRAMALSRDVSVGAVLLDVDATVIHAPARTALKRAIERQTAAAAAPETAGELAWAVRAREGHVTPGLEGESELPSDPLAIGEEILSDDDHIRAYTYLRTALQDPKMRPAVIAALEAFANIAREPGSD